MYVNMFCIFNMASDTLGTVPINDKLGLMIHLRSEYGT